MTTAAGRSRDETEIPHTGIRHALVIRFSAMGDVLLTFPALHALRRRLPDARLTFLTDSRFGGLLEGLEVLDQTRTLDRVGLKRARPRALWGLWSEVLRPAIGGRWDAVIDLQGFGETALIARLTRAPVRIGRRHKTRARSLFTHWVDTPHEAKYMADNHLDTLARAGLLGRADSVAVPRFTISDRGRREWAARCGRQWQQADPADRIALFVGAGKTEKMWPADRFAAVASHLLSSTPRPLRFVVLAGPGEQGQADAALAAMAAAGVGERAFDGGCGSLGALAAAFDDCSVTISNDTGPMHLSVAVGTPTLGIFRRTMPHFTPPPPHRTIAADTLGELANLPVDPVADAAVALLREHHDTGAAAG